MALIHKSDNEWKFKHGKYQGKTLQEVAKMDPGYLAWVHKRASEPLSDEAFYALEDVMAASGIKPD